MSLACTALRTNAAVTKLGKRWHNLKKKKVHTMKGILTKRFGNGSGKVIKKS